MPILTPHTKHSISKLRQTPRDRTASSKCSLSWRSSFCCRLDQHSCSTCPDALERPFESTVPRFAWLLPISRHETRSHSVPLRATHNFFAGPDSPLGSLSPSSVSSTHDSAPGIRINIHVHLVVLGPIVWSSGRQERS
jgi:hypothetical protein